MKNICDAIARAIDRIDDPILALFIVGVFGAFVVGVFCAIFM